MTDALSVQEVLALPAVVDVVTAGRALGIGRNHAYALARAGQFPCRVLRVGAGVGKGTWKMPTADLLAVLGLTPPDPNRPDSNRPDPAAFGQAPAATHNDLDAGPQRVDQRVDPSAGSSVHGRRPARDQRISSAHTEPAAHQPQGSPTADPHVSPMADSQVRRDV